MAEELSQDYEIFAELWRYFKKYRDVAGTEEYWKSVISDAAELHQRYPNGLCRGMLIQIVNEFERREIKK